MRGKENSLPAIPAGFHVLTHDRRGRFFEVPNWHLKQVEVVAVSGGSYEAFLRDNIFAPLKMTDTGYDNHLPIIKNRAAGYMSEGGKLFNSVYVDQSQPFAAGALYGTTAIFCVWIRLCTMGSF